MCWNWMDKSAPDQLEMDGYWCYWNDFQNSHSCWGNYAYGEYCFQDGEDVTCDQWTDFEDWDYNFEMEDYQCFFDYDTYWYACENEDWQGAYCWW